MGMSTIVEHMSRDTWTGPLVSEVAVDVQHVASQLMAWVEATVPRIAQQRYLARLATTPAEQARLLAEAMALEWLCEELQACVRTYSTVRQLRGAVHQILQAMQRELGRMPQGDEDQDQENTDQPSARMQGSAHAYRTAISALAAITGAAER
jgi:hypothetical protein